MAVKGQFRKQIDKIFNCDQIIGDSPELCKSLYLASQVAKTHTTVLITGESGTGKELIGQAIHDNSCRANKPFLPVNCASIPYNLLEAELFGYEEGAFTGANHTKKGLFELAAGGTLFLDEIGDLDFNLQAKLLRVLEERRFQKLGGTKFVDVDVRIVTATNRNLEVMMQHGRFREDLFFRLSVFPINVPPLNKRGDDVILLAEHFIHRFSHDFGRKHPVLSEKAKSRLQQCKWKGNIRQLKNTIERAMILCKKHKIASKHLIINDGGVPETIQQPEIDRFISFLLKENCLDLEKLEARILYHAIRTADYNVSKASKMVGLSRPTLRYRLEKYKDLISSYRDLNQATVFK